MAKYLAHTQKIMGSTPIPAPMSAVDIKQRSLVPETINQWS